MQNQFSNSVEDGGGREKTRVDQMYRIVVKGHAHLGNGECNFAYQNKLFIVF